MLDRSQFIVEAALPVFLRYGVSKTTMGDVATAAGVARQTLYNAFPNKEALLRATTRWAAMSALHTIQAAWVDCEALNDKIDLFFAHGPLAWFDMIQASPEGAELMDGLHQIAADEMAEVGRLWTEALRTVILSHAEAGSYADAQPDAVADHLYSAAVNAKYHAPDRVTVVSRLEVLKQAVEVLCKVQ